MATQPMEKKITTPAKELTPSDEPIDHSTDVEPGTVSVDDYANPPEDAGKDEAPKAFPFSDASKPSKAPKRKAG